MQKQWEYMILRMDKIEKVMYSEGELNQLGAQGWELVSTLYLNGQTFSRETDRTLQPGYFLQYILKRPKP